MSFVLPLFCHLLLAALPAPVGEELELLRDRWGIPHVFAMTDEAAMFGLGYATAEDRLFQMYLNLRTIQGRLSEVLGPVPKRRGRGTALQQDRKMRTFGFWRHARAVAPKLDRETRGLLQAYSDGVNACLEKRRKDLPGPFRTFDLVPEPWSPAACLVTWWHVASFFGTDGTRDLMAWRNRGRPRGTAFQVAPDPRTAVVQREDLSEAWMARLQAFQREHGFEEAEEGRREEGPRFSHAWVVAGSRTTTGSAVLVSDPQTPVSNPNLFYEFHVSGRTFHARGIGVPGSPVLLIGFNQRVAWGATALGADQADLFLLETDEDHPGQYLWDGEWRDFGIRKERILVRGGEARDLEVRETHLGPVVSAFAFRGREDPEVAVRRVPLCDADLDTVQASFAMMRAKDIEEFWKALSGWRFPSMNTVFGDAEGGIGYSVAGAMPLRSRQSGSRGSMAHEGSLAGSGWKGFVPFDLLPHVLRPKRGYLCSANHRPIQAFYRIYLGNSTGSRGDSLRSWRLRERLRARERFSPEEVLDVHRDCVNPARRELVRMALHLRDSMEVELREDAASALQILEPWFKAGASSDLRKPGAALATLLPLNFRRVNTPLTEVFGGGLSGLSRWLQTFQRALARNPRLEIAPEERAYLEDALARALRSARGRFGGDPEEWGPRARKELQGRWMGYHADLDGFPSVDRAEDVNLPPLFCVDGSTIQSQRGQSYTQWVPLHDPDRALSLLPFGQSEDPAAMSRLSTYDLWAEGKLHPAPLSRAAVEKIRRSTRVLRR